jgi:uncharacterized lipoprotein YmbA
MNPARRCLASRRRFLRAAGAAPLLAFAAALAGCAAPLAPVSWIRLPLDPPELSSQSARPDTGRLAASVGAGAEKPPLLPGHARQPQPAWLLRPPVVLPGYLDRDAVLVPQGAAGLRPLDGLRWAEPLRDAVPRLMRRDLERRLGAAVWLAPVPPGASFGPQLAVELLAFDVLPDRRGVAVRARWTLSEASGAAPPRVFEDAFVTAAEQPGPDGLAAAHRLALWRLAGLIVDSARP